MATPVLEYSPLLSDEDLLEIIGRNPIRGTLAAIARRQNVSEPVTEAIVESPDRDAVTALLANPSAQIREETLDRIIDAAPDQEPWHTPLVHRGELSVRAIAPGSRPSSPSSSCGSWRSGTTSPPTRSRTSAAW